MSNNASSRRFEPGRFHKNLSVTRSSPGEKSGYLH